VAILYLGYHGNGRHFEFFQPPKAATYYGGYTDKVDQTMVPNPWISIPSITIYLETKFPPNLRIFVFWWPFWIQNGRHSRPTMDINSQHHNLLGNQISPKSEHFCIWRPFCTLVTMATAAAILNFFNPPKAATHYGGYPYKVS
jgi:hypothetical protein